METSRRHLPDLYSLFGLGLSGGTENYYWLRFFLCLEVLFLEVDFMVSVVSRYTRMSLVNGLWREIIPRVPRGVSVRSTLELLD